MKIEIEKVFNREKGRLLSYIRSKVKSLEDAEDLLQDVFYQTLNGISVTSQIDNIMGWLYTVARNRITDWYRKKRLPYVPMEIIENKSIDDLVSDAGFHPEKVFLRNLLAEAILESVDMLPEEQRTVFLMQEVEGMTFKEISEITGDSINTLISRKRYAVLFLRKQLKEIKQIMDESN